MRTSFDFHRRISERRRFQWWARTGGGGQGGDGGGSDAGAVGGVGDRTTTRGDRERYEQMVMNTTTTTTVMLDEDRRWALMDESELCLVCKSYSGNCAVCRSCYAIHSQSYGVWKAWIEREQSEYQAHSGCTYSNLRWDSIVIQSCCVVNPELLLLKRVKACIGWAVHGLIFEFLDGTRAGYVVDVHSIKDDEAIEKRRSTDWVDIPMGDYIRAIRGFDLSRGCFLCHTLHLDFASGRTVSFASTHDPWKGGPFRYDLPENALLHHVSFREGKCLGVTAAESIMHLPVKSPQRVNLLGREHWRTFRLIQLVANRIDRERVETGERPLGRDLWHTIVCEYLACFDLQPFESSAIGRLQQQQQEFPEESEL